MILTCPSCRSSYKVPDGAITDKGRKVRCASCAHVWQATLADVSSEAPRPYPPRPHQVDPAPSARRAAPSPSVAAPQQPPPSSGPSALDEDDIDADPLLAAKTAAIRKAMLDEAAKPFVYQEDPDNSMADLDDDGLDDGPVDFTKDDDDDDDEFLDAEPPVDAGAVDELASDKMDHDDLGLDGDFDSDLDSDLDRDFDSDAATGDDLAGDDLSSDDLSSDSGASTEEAGDFDIDNFADSLKARYGEDGDIDPVTRHRLQQKHAAELRMTKFKRFVSSTLWLLLLIFWLGLGGVFFGMKDRVVADWPASKRVYAWLDDMASQAALAEANKVTCKEAFVETKGVVIGKPVLTRSRAAGVEILLMSGRIYNEGQEEVELPAMRAAVFGEGDALLDQWQFIPTQATLKPAESIEYNTKTPYMVPEGAQTALVQFFEPACAPVTDAPQAMRITPPAISVEERDGQKYLNISGQIKNEGTRGVLLPKLQATIYDVNRQVLVTWEFAVSHPELDHDRVILSRGQVIGYNTTSPGPMPANAVSAGIQTKWEEAQ